MDRIAVDLSGGAAAINERPFGLIVMADAVSLISGVLALVAATGSARTSLRRRSRSSKARSRTPLCCSAATPSGRRGRSRATSAQRWCLRRRVGMCSARPAHACAVSAASRAGPGLPGRASDAAGGRGDVCDVCLARTASEQDLREVDHLYARFAAIAGGASAHEHQIFCLSREISGMLRSSVRAVTT
jgi:hypothetical protein